MKWLKRLLKKRKPLSPLAQALSEALDQDGWELGEHTMKNSRIKLELWISNGPQYFRVYSANGMRISDRNPGFDMSADEKEILWQKVMHINSITAANLVTLLTHFKGG